MAARRRAAAMVFVPAPAAPVLSPDDVHHLLDVLRLRVGEPVVAGDGAGTWVECRVARPGPARSADPAGVLEVVSVPWREPAPPTAITVAFAPTKGDRPEWVVQKLTEIGVDRIVPIMTVRSVVRWQGDRAVRAGARLERAAREAAAQSRRAWLPEVLPPSPLAGLPGLAAAPVALAEPGHPGPRPGVSAVAVGPEGGWSDDELEHPWPRLGLGPTVLRSETAALVAAALLCATRNGIVGALA